MHLQGLLFPGLLLWIRDPIANFRSDALGLVPITIEQFQLVLATQEMLGRVVKEFRHAKVQGEEGFPLGVGDASMSLT